jgi:hypothetical protein
VLLKSGAAQVNDAAILTDRWLGAEPDCAWWTTALIKPGSIR